MFFEIEKPFESLESWQKWSAGVPQISDARYINDIAVSIALSGFVDLLHGEVRRDQLVTGGGNHREGFLAHGCTSRHRAILTHVIDFVLAHGRCSTIYLSEQASGFANALARHFRYLVMSEYLSDPETRWNHPHLRHEDPLNLCLPDNAFDLYISPESMIFAASMDGFLKEARRILRRTGVLLATFPFRYGEEVSDVRAELKDGELVHHIDPLLLGGAVEKRRLAFFIPGWDILDACRRAGFRDASIVAHSSRKHAVLGAEIAVVFVLRAVA